MSGWFDDSDPLQRAMQAQLAQQGHLAIPDCDGPLVLSNQLGAGLVKTRRRLADLTSAERKEAPITRGAVDYFPDAIAAVSVLSKRANEKHNPGEPMHWSKGKSTDHDDCIGRHLAERTAVDPEMSLMFRVHVAWRALAALQTEIENSGWDAVVLPQQTGEERERSE